MKRIIAFAAVLAIIACGAIWLYAMPLALPTAQYASKQPMPISTSSIGAPEPRQATSGTSQPLLMAFAGTHSLGTATATPAMITANMPTPVTVTISITDPALITTSVNLLQLGASGTQPTILGLMQNTGGGLYSLQHVFNASTTGQIQLEVSAAFVGSLQRLTKVLSAIPIVQPPTFTSANMGLTLNYPADWSVQQNSSTITFSNVPSPSTTPSSSFFQVYYLPQANPSQLPIAQWFSQFSQLAPFPPISVNSISIGTNVGVIATVSDIGADTKIFLPRGTDIIEISYDSEAQQFSGEYAAMLNSITL